MGKYWIVLFVVLAFVGCSNRNRDGMVSSGLDPITEQDQEPLEEQQHHQLESMNGKDVTLGDGTGALQPVFFDYNRHDITSTQIPVLNSNARQLRDGAEQRILIEGHCDERGTEEYNLALGDRRARATKDFLVATGIPASSIRTISYGENRPFENGHDENAWSMNRRAHFVKER